VRCAARFRPPFREVDIGLPPDGDGDERTSGGMTNPLRHSGAGGDVGVRAHHRAGAALPSADQSAARDRTRSAAVDFEDLFSGGGSGRHGRRGVSSGADSPVDVTGDGDGRGGINEVAVGI
jgi:hypothetical protein